MKPVFCSLALVGAFSLSWNGFAWEPAPASMLSEWGEAVTPENVWTEYPRPILERVNWTNLNGLWEYAVTDGEQRRVPKDWDGEILVPFALESALSGVKQGLRPDQALWYRRSFATPDGGEGERTLLNFEAVDYFCELWLNDKELGSHTGGNLPFSFDITEYLKRGKNTLVLKVVDRTDTQGAYQTHGKQRLDPSGIWYTPVSGIWQTVWLEQVPEYYVTEAKITPSIDGTVDVVLKTVGKGNGQDASVVVSLAGQEVARASGPPSGIRVNIPDPQLWSPDSPTLYDITIQLGNDIVESYTGLRETTVVEGEDGHLRLALNGEIVFHWGTLDQGWWPGGLLTPPSDAAMASDIHFLKAAGFNMLRKHIKVEPRRYYTHCDRIGILVWQDQVSTGFGKNRIEEKAISSAEWTKLAPDPADAVWPEDAHEQFMAEFQVMVDTLYNHPSIVQWVPFNEGWGQHRTLEVGRWIADYDPTRQVNIASGGNFFPVGHIVDGHKYPNPRFPFEFGEGGRFDGFVKVIGEFGGHGFPVEGHLWDPEARNWGYGKLPKDEAEWRSRYRKSLEMLTDLKDKGIAAGLYTQTSDVEGEVNGLLTYDRKVRKITAEELSQIHSELGLIER
ncbi:glycoside hydrolase family 2 TIM barrel-domain containing protein [Pelagicoccus enzymogenes]|uniref:glycoside hydrolase family 2 protein n=1 Tax=Pelagicoccus enzymogenes TaxID=2773457 RepID=UPI00281071F1|nr:sugar-binding domain-containing protein [Pelagicoccus enzymogenes]MDQ8199409.1 glycoside hydrolase family 2 TIM barrel-domain containing protein [Pelagicoccus enzymogenes]